MKGNFMKKNIGIMALSLLIASTAFATTGSVRYTCTNDEETVVLCEISTGVFQADVTEQSVGDSDPTFHFKNVQQKIGLGDVARGAPETYSGKGFELTIAVDAPEMPATLDAPSIGIKSEKVNCK